MRTGWKVAVVSLLKSFLIHKKEGEIMNNNDWSEDEKKADTLSVISLRLIIVPTLLIVLIKFRLIYINGIISLISHCLLYLCFLCYPASLILLIFVRVKYPDNKKSKVVLGIICTVAGFVLFALLIIYVVHDCLMTCTRLY